MSKTKTSTPILVAIIGALSVLAGILFLLGGVLSFVAAGVIDDMALPAGVTGGVLIVLGLIMIIFGMGFLKGWSIMWYLGVVIYAIDIVVSIFALPAGIISILFGIVVLWYLFRPKVKTYFLGRE